VKTEDRIRDPERLEALRTTGLLDAPRVPVLDEATRMAVRLLRVRTALVTLVAENRQIILSSAGAGGLPPPRQTPLSQSMCRHLLADDAPLTVDDTRRDERWRGIGSVRRGETAAYAGTPLHAPGGQPLGALCVIDDRPHPWDREELEILGGLAVMAEAEIGSRAERRLRERLEREHTFLSALLDSLQAPVAACDDQGRLVRFNQPMRELMHASEQPMDTDRWAPAYGMFAPDGRTLLAPGQVPLARALAGERFDDQEVVVRALGAPPRRFLTNGRPIETPGGRRLGAVTSGHEITARHRIQTLRDVQHAVAEALAMATSAEHAACNVIGAITRALDWVCGEYWQADPGGARLTRTGSWVRPGRDLSAFTGPEPKTVPAGQGLPGRVEAAGRPLWIRDLRADPGVTPRIGAALDAGLRTAVGLPVHSGGRLLAVLTFFAGTVEEPDEELLDLLGGACAHIGRYMERRRAEDLALALTASRRRFDQIVAQVNDLVWTLEIDDDGRARSVYVSGNAPGVLGSRGPHDFDEAYVSDHVHPDDRGAFAGMLAEFRAERPAEAEYRVTGLDGVSRWIWSRAVPRREDGRLLVDGVSTDVTDRRKVAEDRERLLAREREQVRRLRELDRMKDELVAVVSHEVRSPVAVIRSYAEMLAADPALDGERRMFADVIDRRSAHLQHLVDDLLDLARLDGGRLRVDARPLSLNRLVRQAVDDHRAAAEAKHLTVTVELDRHLAVQADPVRLRQLLDNLLSNAVKYTPEGGSVAVTAGCGEDGGDCGEDHGGGEHRGGTVTLTVADTGIGVPTEQYPRLFDRFFRASTAHEAGIKGTGLGLAVTKAIVEAHGGTITAAPREGGGTSFTVRLPAGPPASR
jgi:signal transduction histidine kinase